MLGKPAVGGCGTCQTPLLWSLLRRRGAGCGGGGRRRLPLGSLQRGLGGGRSTPGGKILNDGNKEDTVNDAETCITQNTEQMRTFFYA